ncbi:MAG: phosphoribosyl-AMP cyclohydrolase [Alphaproteobacteria bacterium]|jgi:phosphoribosyl-AMP cyclohydrolase|nr:phosphoribosyl-AMP cyclohydrolase [Alphaproteobacteria bacterium]MBT5827370.1 phosphoribosyl-AMP cyclohydrolase [Alphaproteobacteria bacterium]
MELISNKVNMKKDIAAEIKYNDKGLVPVIAQEHKSKEVLMLAWMNKDAIAETLATNKVCYWSRSRKKLWRKGETSGHFQTLKEFRYDCDKDTVLVLVEQIGPACHTNRPNCFYYAVRGEEIEIISEPMK